MRAFDAVRRLVRPGPIPVSTAEGYSRWAPVYPPRPHNALMETEASVVAPLLRASAPRRALDVGTGTGRNLATLTAAGATFVVGLDMSQEMLACGRHASPLVCGDALRLPFAASTFDSVSSSLMCGDIEDIAAWVGEAVRVLRPGGQLVYSDFHPAWVRSGWRRTFVGQDGRTYELPFFPHALEAHADHLRRQGVEVREVRQAALPGGTTPVLVVVHAVKSSRGKP